MKKEQPKRLVLQQLTKSDIENIGLNRAIKRIWKPYVTGACLILIGLLINSALTEGTINLVIDAVLIVILLCICALFSLSAYRAGKKFWNRVKDREEPIKL